MEKLKQALSQLPHIQAVWVDPKDANVWFYRAKANFKEMKRGEVLAEVKPKKDEIKAEDKKSK